MLISSWWIELGVVILTIFSGVYIYFVINYQYWKKKGIPYLEPSFPFGNVPGIAMYSQTIAEGFLEIYKKLKHHKVAGIFQVHKPSLFFCDPELIKTVLVKDFAHFHDRGFYYDEEGDPLSAQLIFLEGAGWRHMRHKLNPSFTLGKMKMLFPIISNTTGELVRFIDSLLTHDQPIEVKEIMSKFSTDVIANCAFGIESNSLKDPNSEFRRIGMATMEPNWRTNLRDKIVFTVPYLAALLKIPVVPRHLGDFFISIVKETIAYRMEHNITRKDFLQLLINMRGNKAVKDVPKESNQDSNEMTDVQIAAQAFVFFIAGFETSSTTMSFCMYELAVNKTIQERLRDEIDSVVADHGGQITYEGIQQMAYLENIVLETLRKYPPIPVILRVCTKEYRLPETNVTVEVGTPIVISVTGLHHDPAYYPGPDVFEPNRFTEEERSKRHNYVYLPMGGGPRYCIGAQFGLAQIKIGIATIISRYQLQVCNETAIPPEMDTKSFVNSPKGGIVLRIRPRNET